MTWSYTKPAFEWDGKKFRQRYSLGEFDFWDNGQGQIVTTSQLPDDPPIFEAPDPFIPVPSGVRVHHWPELAGWVGSKKITHSEDGVVHHECYYVIADNEVALNNLAAMPYVNFAVGQPAYLKDKLVLVTWDGTKWK